MPERIVNRDTRAKQRRGFFGLEPIGHGGHGFRGSDHIFGVAAIVAKASDLLIPAKDEITAPAPIAMKTVAAVPADAYALSHLPLEHTLAQAIDASCNFVARHARVF